MRTILLLLISSVLLSGCDSDDQISPIQATLDLNQTKWANANLNSYRFTVDRSCFCAPEEDIVVNVMNDAVVSAFFTPSGIALDSDRIAQVRTIDDYFGLIQRGIDEEFARLDVEYNPDFGFPASISIDQSLQIADEEVTYQIGELQ